MKTRDREFILHIFCKQSYFQNRHAAQGCITIGFIYLCNVSLVFPHASSLLLSYQIYGWQVISQQNNSSFSFPLQQKQDIIHLLISCQSVCCGLNSSKILCHGAKNLEVQIPATTSKLKDSCIRWGDREDGRVP